MSEICITPSLPFTCLHPKISLVCMWTCDTCDAVMEHDYIASDAAGHIVWRQSGTPPRWHRCTVCRK